MKRFVMLVALLLMLPVVAGAATAKSSASAGTKSAKPRFDATDKVTATATVLSVNSSNRHVKLRTESGDTVIVECGPEVKNFAQIKKGDVVNATYTERLSVTVEGPGTAAVTNEETSSQAKPGQKPSAGASQKVTYKATISSIDKEAKTATLKGYDGQEFTVTPRNPANLDKVNVGDLVVFTYTVAVAVSVEKAAAK